MILMTHNRFSGILSSAEKCCSLVLLVLTAILKNETPASARAEWAMLLRTTIGLLLLWGWEEAGKSGEKGKGKGKGEDSRQQTANGLDVKVAP